MNIFVCDNVISVDLLNILIWDNVIPNDLIL